MTYRRDMVRRLPWPYSDGRFPRELGAVIQRTVLDGQRPALLVWHSEENDWAIGDGIDDPNEPGANVVTHIWHVIERDLSLAELASMPLGSRADRPAAEAPWTITRTSDEP